MRPASAPWRVTVRERDPYIDLETGVLRNRLGITDAAELVQAESELTSYRLIELRRTGLSGRYDLANLQAFHRYIFGDLYDWAGELRSVSIGKGPIPGGRRPDPARLPCAARPRRRAPRSIGLGWISG